MMKTEVTALVKRWSFLAGGIFSGKTLKAIKNIIPILNSNIQRRMILNEQLNEFQIFI